MNENREMRLHGEELSQGTGGAGNAKHESALERMREAMKKATGSTSSGRENTIVLRRQREIRGPEDALRCLGRRRMTAIDPDVDD